MLIRAVMRPFQRVRRPRPRYGALPRRCKRRFGSCSDSDWSVVRSVHASQLGAAVAEGAHVVDLRSPKEHAKDHFPGSHNVPLLLDAQRSVVGTLYTQQSRESAYEQGIRYVEERLRPLLGALGEGRAAGSDNEGNLTNTAFRDVSSRVRELQVEAAAPGTAPKHGHTVLYCARGGHRSQSVAGLLQRLGWKGVWIVQDGYRGMRRQTQAALARADTLLPERVYVLSGPTGVGKTRVLQLIEEKCEGSTIDLEALAQHRGSLLGHVGLRPSSQKSFESGLHARLVKGFPHRFAIIEDESRSVGNCIVPDAFWERLSHGARLRLESSTEARVEHLTNEYVSACGDDPEPLCAALDDLESLIVRRNGVGHGDAPRVLPAQLGTGALSTLVREGKPRDAARWLIENWYDKRYKSAERAPGGAVVDAEDPAAAADQVLACIEADGLAYDVAMASFGHRIEAERAARGLGV